MSRDEALRNQLEIKRVAVAEANRRMREEILPKALEAFFDDPSSQITGSSQALLSQTWSPFELDPSQGFEATLQASDPLVLEVMKDLGLLARSKVIMRDALMREQFASKRTPALVRSILEDLIAPDKPVYAAEEMYGN